MKRKERKELRGQQNRADKLIYDLGVFYFYFKDKPIGFDTLHVYNLARTFTDTLVNYRNTVEDKLKYKPRRKKK